MKPLPGDDLSRLIRLARLKDMDMLEADEKPQILSHLNTDYAKQLAECLWNETPQAELADDYRVIREFAGVDKVQLDLPSTDATATDPTDP